MNKINPKNFINFQERLHDLEENGIQILWSEKNRYTIAYNNKKYIVNFPGNKHKNISQEAIFKVIVMTSEILLRNQIFDKEKSSPQNIRISKNSIIIKQKGLEEQVKCNNSKEFERISTTMLEGSKLETNNEVFFTKLNKILSVKYKK